jgi:cysteine synthase
VCAAKGYPFVVLSSDAFAREKLQTMSAFGADVRIVPSDGGKVTPALFERFRREIAVLAGEPDTFWTDQFHNTDALDGYAEMGREILAQTAAEGITIDVFCAAVGTAGMLVGVTGPLRASTHPLRVVAFEPASSPTLTAGGTGPHRVEGIATGMVPPLLTSGTWDEARTVDEAQARLMAVQLARRAGLFAGTSSALNITGAIALATELGAGRTVVTIAIDTGLKYLAGDLFSAQPETLS